MLAKITLYDGTVYRIASQTVDAADGLYLGRIKDELSLVSAMQEAGNAPATVNLTIINHDDFIPHSKDLWAADVLLTTDNNISWRGKINFCNFDADGILYVTASEKTAPELELQLPDEVRQVYTIDEDFHQSSVTMTIPLVIGGTTSNPITLPTILIDKTRGIYLICVGEIRSVLKVYNGAKELPQTAYTAYTGTASQEENAGFAYVQIAEDYRLNSDGSYAEINVEVVGLKLGNFTEEECRNGALFLYYFLTTAATGINGWGCGIDPSEIDTASFQSAITLCNQLGYKLDGIMWLRQSAQSWIDQICQAIHGKYSINANGKRSLFIDYAGNASKKTFTASNMRVDRYGKNSYTSVVYNKGVLSYDYNPITGLFMQSAQYENADSIAQIGEQKFIGESYLIKDATTALAVLEYTCKRSQTAAEAIEFKTDDINTVLRAGDVITINRPDLSINNAFYQIQNISITDYEASISAVKFDTSVFIVSGTPSSVNWGSEKAITPALTPAQATNLLLSTGFDINPDGTGTPYISGTFTVPDGGWLAAAVQYGIGASPSNWTELALITDGRFKISPVNVGTVYSVRIRMITSTGHSDYITGQITATGDTTPPAEPTIAVNATDKTVTVQCGLDNPPYDMGGFQIYRKKSTEADSAYTLIAMVAANRGYASYSDYVSEYITYNYKAKSYDRSGNLSTNFSNVASVTVTGIQANDVAATALAMPTGSILRLSAKNCTTASIAEVNGVKDVSGNGNHGQAAGGVTVLDGGEEFSFNNGYLDFSSSERANFLALFTGMKALTMSCRMTISQFNSTAYSFTLKTGSINNRVFALYFTDSIIGFGGRWCNQNAWESADWTTTLELNKEYTITGVADFENGKIALYVDAEKVAEKDDATAQVMTSCSYVRFGGAIPHSGSSCFLGNLRDIRIYPRALSASEIKTLYMFPDDVTFGQMTADLIGANVIKAQNLIMTENVISNAAQINNAVFQSLIVTNGSTVANQVSVGGRNLILGTQNFSGTWGNSNSWTTNGSYRNLTVKQKSNAAWGGLYKETTVEKGKTYIFSAYIKCTTANEHIYVSGGTATVSPINKYLNTIYSDWTKVELVFTCSASGTVRPRFELSTANGTLSVCGYKLEEGNKATDWTPAPEDTDASINAITTNIYSPNTTTINGGKITTGTITAAAIAANAITAEKIVVKSMSVPSGEKFHFSLSSTSDYSMIPDASGNGNYSTMVGSIGINDENANPFIGKYPNFAPTTTKYYNTSYYPMSGTTATSVTLSAWIAFNKPSAADSAWTVYLGQQGGSYSGWGLTIYGQILYAVIRTSANLINVNLDYSWGNWAHVVITINVDSSNITLKGYSNGVLKGTATLSGSTFSSALSQFRLGYPAFIGGSGSSSIPSAIRFADVRVFNRALSEAEVQTLYAIGTDTKNGTITADRIATDCLRSRDFTDTNADILAGKAFSTTGTFFNLAGIGSITSKKFRFGSDGSCAMGAFSVQSDGSFKSSFGTSGYVELKYNKGLRILDPAHDSDAEFNPASTFWTTNATGFSQQVYVATSNNGSTKDAAIIKVNPNSTSLYGLYVKGKARIWDADVTSDESLKKDLKEVSTLEKLKNLRILSWRFDEEKIVEQENLEIDEENAKIDAENKKIDAENIEIEKENENRKNRKDGEPIELLPLKEHIKKLRTHKTAKKDTENALKIGCMAGEFNKAFGTNNGSEDCLSVTDTIGVCMRAIQELAAEVDELKAKLKIQQGEKSDVELKEPTNEKNSDTENGDVEPSFDELLKNDENQQDEQK